MENNIKVPTLEELKNRWDENNKRFLTKNEVDFIGFQQIIDVLNYSEKFLNYIYEKWYDRDFLELSYIIYWEIVNYLKYCYDNWNYNEIEKMLEFVDKKMQSEVEYINTLAQVWVLEILDIYPEILPKILELMPKYSKDIFMKHYSHYLKLKK